jgi:hypothetical protein
MSGWEKENKKASNQESKEAHLRRHQHPTASISHHTYSPHAPSGLHKVLCILVQLEEGEGIGQLNARRAYVKRVPYAHLIGQQESKRRVVNYNR